MKLKIIKNKFEKEIKEFFKIVNPNSAFIPLRGVLIDARKDEVILIASNGNLSIKHIIKDNSIIKVFESGKVLVNSYIFRNIIKKQSDEIDLSVEGKTLKIYSNKTKADVQLFNIRDYPSISFDIEGEEIVVDGLALNKVINNVSFASAENDARIILNGVNLKSSKGKMILTATDSFRLATETLNIESQNEFDVTIISKNLKNFIPRDISGMIKINVDDYKIITKNKNTTIVSKIIDGIFPDTKPLIPTEFKFMLSMESRDLKEIIDKVTVLSDESNIPILLTIKKEELKIESKRREMGKIEVKYQKHAWSGEEEFSIVVSSQFLKDAITKFKGKIAIAFNGPFQPIVIKGVSNENLIQLVLPQRTY